MPQRELVESLDLPFLRIAYWLTEKIRQITKQEASADTPVVKCLAAEKQLGILHESRGPRSKIKQNEKHSRRTTRGHFLRTE